MAIDPRLSLIPGATSGERARGAVEGFQNALLSLRGQDPTTLGRQRDILGNQLLQEQIAGQQAQTEQQGQLNRIRSLAVFAGDVEGDVRRGDLSSIRQKTESRVEQLRQQGQNPNDSQELLRLIDNPNLTDEQKLREIESLSGEAIANAQRFGAITATAGQTAGQRERASLLRDLEGATDESGRLKPVGDLTIAQRTAAVEAGLLPRATGSAAQTIAAAGTAQQIGASEAVIAEQKAAAKETGKLASQLKLQPDVKAAVEGAVAQARADVKLQEGVRDNDSALQTYETAMTGLVESLGGTTTGPIAGFLPAFTESQQIADGAVAAMSPILKQIFRSAGEGTFTDSDQRLLNEMIPTRTDRPAARVAKLENIDAIVRAKLGRGQAAQPPAAPQGQFTPPIAPQQASPAAGGFRILSVE